jgi:hypothetical protein
MKKASFLFVSALGAATMLAAPVMAQPSGWDIDRRIHWVQDRIIHGRDDGSLDRREFDRVQGELNGIRDEERRVRYNHGGYLDERARVDLQFKLDHLNDQIHWIHVRNETRPW